jgi:hypothetical protein
MSRVLTLLLVVVPWMAYGYVLRTDAAGHDVQWATSPTFVMSPSLAQTLGVPEAQDAAKAAVATYAADLPQLGLTFQVGANQPLGYDPTPGAINQNDILTIDQNWPYDENAIAITLLTVDPATNDILDADIVLNTESHTFAALAADSQPGGLYDDLQNTLTHELGHALGLAHNTGDATVVMYPGAPKGQVSKRVLTDDDRAGLAFLYTTGSLGGANAPHAMGCSAGQGGPSVALLALFLALAFKRSARTTARVVLTKQ